ncbi:MAG: malic enzyme-like NAD(P)-binding protein [Bacteroidia bacterium]
MISLAMQESGISEEKARQNIWFMDSKGLVCASRNDLARHKLEYAHEHPFINSLEEAVKILKPQALIGVSGQGGTFTEEIIRLMAEINEKPIIFALSNPTSQSECTAEQAYNWTNGKAIFASGSPFAPVEYKGKKLIPGQGNNVYIFPGIGLGLSYCHAQTVPDRMFFEAAKEVANSVSEEELASGTVYPSFQRIKEVSIKIAAAVVKVGVEEGGVPGHYMNHVEEKVRNVMYTPEYPDYL